MKSFVAALVVAAAASVLLAGLADAKKGDMMDMKMDMKMKMKVKKFKELMEKTLMIPMEWYEVEEGTEMCEDVPEETMFGSPKKHFCAEVWFTFWT